VRTLRRAGANRFLARAAVRIPVVGRFRVVKRASPPGGSASGRWCAVRFVVGWSSGDDCHHDRIALRREGHPHGVEGGRVIPSGRETRANDEYANTGAFVHDAGRRGRAARRRDRRLPAPGGTDGE